MQWILLLLAIFEESDYSYIVWIIWLASNRVETFNLILCFQRELERQLHGGTIIKTLLRMHRKKSLELFLDYTLCGDYTI